MRYEIILVGLNAVGVNFAREFGRFLANYEENRIIHFVLVDENNVEEKDLEIPFFLPEDIGWNRAATVKMILDSQFSKKFYSKAYILDRSKLKRQLSYIFSRTCFEKISILIDCAQDSKITKLLHQFHSKKKDCILIHPYKNGIQVQQRIDGKPIARRIKKFVGSSIFSYGNSLTLANLMLAQVCNLIANQVNSIQTVFACHNALYTGTQERSDFKYKQYSVPLKGNIAIICVGAGGTGGNFCKMAVYLLQKYRSAHLILVDGDTVEEKNRTRQPFSESDLLQNKAVVLKENLFAQYPEISSQMSVYPHYIKETKDLSHICQGYEYVILLGCVDNHRARQVLHSFSHERESIVYIDSANEFSVGEVVVTVKINGIQQSPPRSFYYPDVLTDDSPAAYELSCGEMNQSTPQHQVTNLTAAAIVFQLVEELLQTHQIRGGIVYFNAFQCFSRFQPVNCEEVRMYATIP